MSWAEDEGFDGYDEEEIAAYAERQRRPFPHVATADDFEDLTKEDPPG